MTKIPITVWAGHSFSVTIKNDHVTNNSTESFNAWVGDFRGLPILTLVEGLRSKFMKKLHNKYQKSCISKSIVPPKIVEKLTPKEGNLKFQEYHASMLL